MKKTCVTFGSDGKGNGLASKADVVGKALQEYLEEKDREAYHFALSLCRDEDEAQELVQEACYRVLRESRRYDPSKPVKSWLFTILRNAFTDSRRRVERRMSVSLDFENEDGTPFLHELLGEKSEDIEAVLESEERAEKVRAALSRLSKLDRQALALCDAQGMRYAEAAERLNVPQGTLRSRLHRARIKFRRAARRFGLG